MKVRASVKKMCAKCRTIKRKGKTQTSTRLGGK